MPTNKRHNRTRMRISSLLLFSLTISKCAVTSASPSTDEQTKMTSGTQRSTFYYQRYPAYPEYCSSPQEMASRVIPKLNIESTGLDSGVTVDLVQVNTVIRHGQRTPYGANIPCWAGYHDQDADTSKWDCQLTSWTSPPRFNPTDKYLLFEKKYDALSPPLGNLLGGSCQLGQLLVTGYEQETTNGRILRDAYFGNDGQYGGMSVFLHNDTSTEPYNSRYTVYRVDDEQRTLMSGQVLLRALFHEDVRDYDSVIETHTADMANDILHPNEQLCPTLTKLREEAEQSSEFQKRNSSSEAKELRGLLTNVLGSEGMSEWGEWQEPIDNILDCLMTTICTDKTLPDELNDFRVGTDGESSLFQRLVDFATWKDVFHFKYNNGEYSKLAMGPLWNEILSKIVPLKDITSLGATGSSDFFKVMEKGGIPRMALYSGHDTTVMPLLASLGDDVWDGTWAPYASMLVIEIYTITGPSFYGPLAFRLLYNGKVITGRLENCPASSDLCSLDVLLDIVGPFATYDRPSCAIDIEAKSFFGSLVDHTSNMLQNPMEKYAVVMISLGSAFIGWFVTYVTLMKRIPFKGRRQPRAVDTGELEAFGHVS